MNEEGLFWVVWNPTGHAPRVRHQAGHLADSEAVRLATDNPGQTFYVLKAVRVAQLPRPEAILRDLCNPSKDCPF